MKKLILLFFMCSFTCTSKAIMSWYGEVIHITSTDSTVLVFIDGAKGVALYKINFDNSDRIIWKEENDSALCMKIAEEYDRYRWCRYSDTKICGPELEVYIKTDWDRVMENDSLMATIDWQKTSFALFGSPSIGVYHTTTNGDVWLGGYCFLGYFHNGNFRLISYIDLYEKEGTDVIFCETDENCPEPEQGYPDPSYVCFCDNRKIGYIQSKNGYVNFHTRPVECASLIGIILDKVRIFYWENWENDEKIYVLDRYRYREYDNNPDCSWELGQESPDWYMVEINGVIGYVRKDNIINDRK